MSCKALLVLVISAMAALTLTLTYISSFDRLTIPMNSFIGIHTSSILPTSSDNSPNVGSHLRTFNKHSEYFDLSASGDKDWSAILPSNGGFIVQKYPDGSRKMAGISMFHQLHCLQMIRGAIQDLRSEIDTCKNPQKPVDERRRMPNLEDIEHEALAGRLFRKHAVADDHDSGIAGPSFATPEEAHTSKHGTHDSMHWVHCLDYLMQGVLCAADSAIEHAHDDEGLRVDGYGTQHMCRDPTAVWKLATGKTSTSPFKAT